MNTHHCLLLPVLLALVSALPSGGLFAANITTVAWYRLGENDSGAASGQAVKTTTTDLVGVNPLRRFGSPRYTNDVSPDASSIGSSLAVLFNGAGYYSNAVASTARNNFGIEAWVKNPSTANGTYFIAHNGAAAANGWGLQMVVTNHPILGLQVSVFGELGGGIVVGSGGSRRVGGWTHVALVRDNGTSGLYVNGVASGTTTTTTPAPPAGGFTIAGSPSAPGGFFPGVVDEVRVFTFAPGQFSTADLLVNQRLVATLPPDGFAPGRATLNGTSGSFGFDTTAWFEWGPTTNVVNITTPQALGAGFTITNFSNVLTGLTANATFFFRAVTSNSMGLVAGSTLEFSTRPTADTLPATDIGSHAATLNGVANPKGVPAAVWFEWGTTTNYGNTTPARQLAGDGNPTNLSESVSNLFPGGTFHFRAVLSNDLNVVTGTNRTFLTPANPAADQVLPGAVVVTIQPAEAVAEGARWSLDGGPQMFSGFTQGVVAPGRHTIQFLDLPAWIEPVPVEVYVVGGRTSVVSVVHTPVPAFTLGTVPEQHARAGQPLEFFVTDVPPGGVLQVTAVPPPAGSFTFDPATGRVRYTPAAADHVPFTVSFSVDGVLAATSTVTPLQTLPPEEAVIQYDRPLPSDESRDYITISENQITTPELFNNVSTQVFLVDISGKTLVFEAAHPAHLHRVYNERENIKELRLYADKVIIRSPLVLPQTRVTIHARELRFEGGGLIDTTPRSRWTKPRAVEWADDNVIGFPGSPGHHGGDVEVFVERFHADAPAVPRFIMRGGDGGPAGEGRNGVFEGGAPPNPVFFPGFPVNPADVNYLANSNWMRLMARSGNPTNCGIANNRLRFYSDWTRNGVTLTNFTCGSETTAARGEPAVRSGIPGAGGHGGTLRSTLDLGAYVSQGGGVAGTNGGNYTGGTLVYQYVYEHIIERTVGPNPGIDVSYVQAPKVPGADATAPSNTNGPPGSVVVIPNPSSWLHSFGLRAVVRFAKDAYLNGRVTETRALLSDYRELLQVLQPEVGSVTNLSEAEFAETTSLDQLSQEMGAIVDRIDMNLDFFGNPAGWVPMLSFEANLTAFQDEINRSIPILYLAYWMNYSATNLQNSALASEETLRRLREELTKLVEAYNQVQTSLPGLKIRSADIQARIAGLHSRLQFLEQELVARAQANVEEKHKVPFWKKGIRILAVAADLVPIGQPTVGRIGEGLKLLTQIDPNHPLGSALRVTNVFGVLSNKDVSICFSGSVTNGTNQPGGTNTVSRSKRKEQLKQLSNCGKFLKSEFKEIASIFKDVQVDSKELQAEIEKLKASDPVFKQLTEELVVLNKDKERFAAELAAALQAIAALASDMTENVLATDEMEVRVANQFAALDHNALVHIKEMERRAKDRLLKFQYFTAQAFQYRLLLAFDGDFQLNTLFDRFQAIVAGTNAHVLSQQEFENLKQLFQADLANTIGRTLTTLNANAPLRELPRTFNLSAAELQTLNTNDQLTINLAGRGLFPSTHEDIRIVNLRVTGVRAHPVGGPLGNDAVLFLDFNHLGESRISRNGQNFRFRHYQSATVSPISWTAVFDAVNQTTNNSVLGASSQSLLRALLNQPTDANMLLFSRPAADADILIRREVLSDNGIDLALDQVTVSVDYEYANQNPAFRTLDVSVTEDLQPVIALSQPDAAGRQDGQGDFRRIYPANIPLTLFAPATYGGRPFDQWVINNVARPAGSNTVTVTLTSGTTAEARYGELPASGVAPSLTQPPANVVAELGTTATFTVGAGGTGPLTFLWRKNGTALTNDGRITGATNATLTISNVTLSDAAAYSVLVSNPFGTATSPAATLTVVAPSLAPVPAGPGNVGFQFATVAGRRYIIERKFTLADPAWISVETNNGTGGPLTFTRPIGTPTSFFRLRAE